MIAASALGCRSLIAGHEGRLEAQVQLAEDAIALAREHGLEDNAAAPTLALGVSLAARSRPVEALPLLERGVAVARFQGQPLLLVRALRYLGETPCRPGGVRPVGCGVRRGQDPAQRGALPSTSTNRFRPPLRRSAGDGQCTGPRREPR